MRLRGAELIEAMNILVNVHGAGSFAESSPLQRYWRDVNTAARHAGLYEVVGYEIFGKSLLGVDELISQMYVKRAGRACSESSWQIAITETEEMTWHLYPHHALCVGLRRLWSPLSTLRFG